MILSSYYNKENDCLSMNFSLNEACSYESDNNITKIFDKDKNLVAINDFNSDIKEIGYISFDMVCDKYKEIKELDLNSNFVYGLIKEIKKHPKSDKLKVCTVDLGTYETQIVCGAKNCDKDNVAIVAKVGSVMINGMKIVSNKLLNEESNGMLCSLKELGIDNNEEGIKLFEVGSKEIGSIVKRSDLI